MEFQITGPMQVVCPV